MYVFIYETRDDSLVNLCFCVSKIIKIAFHLQFTVVKMLTDLGDLFFKNIQNKLDQQFLNFFHSSFSLS